MEILILRISDLRLLKFNILNLNIRVSQKLRFQIECIGAVVTRSQWFKIGFTYIYPESPFGLVVWLSVRGGQVPGSIPGTDHFLYKRSCEINKVKQGIKYDGIGQLGILGDSIDNSIDKHIKSIDQHPTNSSLHLNPGPAMTTVGGYGWPLMSSSKVWTRIWDPSPSPLLNMLKPC